MVIFVNPDSTTTVDNDPIGLGTTTGKIAIVAPARSGAHVELQAVPPSGIYIPPVYCAPLLSLRAEDLGIYLCRIAKSLTSVAGRVYYQIRFKYPDGTEEKTPAGSFTVSDGVIPTLPTDPPENIYEEIASVLAATNANYAEVIERLAAVEETANRAKETVEENLIEISASLDASERHANDAKKSAENAKASEKAIEEAKQLLSSFPKYHYKVVDELPTSDIDISKMYLLRAGGGENDYCIEYLFVPDVIPGVGEDKRYSEGEGVWEKIGDVQISIETDPTLTQAGAAADAKATGDRFESVEKDIADLLYKEITIQTFTNTVGTVEIGSTVNDVNLSWTFSKTPKTVTLDGAAQEVASKGKTLTGLSLTANKTWTLKATDERDAVATKTTSVSFVNGVYYGASAAQDTYDRAFILALTRSLRGSKLPSFTANAGAGQHIYYCLPKRYGTCTFTVGGFEGGFDLVATISFENASGYIEDYYVYKSGNAGLGSTTVEVK